MSIGGAFNNIHLRSNSFSTSVLIKSLSIFPKHRDFVSIDLQLGGKYGKKKTNACKQKQPKDYKLVQVYVLVNPEWNTAV